MIDEAQYDEAICSKCKRRVSQGRMARFDHDDCEPTLHDTVRQREAIRRLHLSTAKMLQRSGHAEEAQYHFSEAERES